MPGIRALQQQAEQLRLAELDRSRARLGDLTPEQQAAVEALTRALTNKFLHAPMTAMREAANAGNATTLEELRRMYKLNG